jgi:YHS domain-containing protein
MKNLGFILGAVVLAFVLATANTTTFANSCCGAKKDSKECNMEDAKDCAMNVNASENPENACAVCGKAADSKGQQVDTKHAGETVHLCCEGCLNAYNQNPDKYSKAEKRKVPVKRNERTTAY